MTPLRHRMIEDMQIRNLTPNTQRVYVEQVARFARHFRRSPEYLGPAEIRSYLLYLVHDKTWFTTNAWRPVRSLSPPPPCGSSTPSPSSGPGVWRTSSLPAGRPGSCLSC
jgi:hypothetical protein